ncbi:MAG: 23S rRNA (uridine(2552)-2'-O)-methyltransferase RlmE [Halothiobacillaceae bacterium]|jgi:23S rRNA (uridine2552-2'-O)-methyltransferase|nr:23S rRNA (uridine(2552)-2'-O)-methyltransferase RlmE [Halothiobacillaceae bacterium]
MSRSGSSRRWLREHFQDEYVLRAQREGFRSRAVYKLMEIQERDRILRPGMRVVDLGAAPGGWSQLAGNLIGDKGRLVALDILPMDAFPGVEFIQGDFTEEAVLERLLTVLDGRGVDFVLSDMAPNMSGMDSVDQPRAMYLAELALDFCRRVLNEDGGFLVKVFQGAGFDAYVKEVRQGFSNVTIRKPKASRPRSREAYILARGARL